MSDELQAYGTPVVLCLDRWGCAVHRVLNVGLDSFLRGLGMEISPIASCRRPEYPQYEVPKDLCCYRVLDTDNRKLQGAKNALNFLLITECHSTGAVLPCAFHCLPLSGGGSFCRVLCSPSPL